MPPKDPERSYQHVIFDFDGVLCDSLEAAVGHFNAIRDKRFQQLPAIKSRDDMTLVYSGLLRDALRHWLTKSESEEFFDAHSSLMAKTAPELRTFPGVGRMLQLLGHGRSSIVTSAYSDAVRVVLASDREFDDTCLFRIAGRELRQGKTEKIREILRDLNLDVKDAVYVGDLESDVLYCKGVPIDIISVCWGYHPSWYLADKGATYLTESMAGLEELLLRVMAKGEYTH